MITAFLPQNQPLPMFLQTAAVTAQHFGSEILTTEACAYQPSLTTLRDPQPRIQQPVVVRDASTLPWLAYQLKKNADDAEKTPTKTNAKARRAFESIGALGKTCATGARKHRAGRARGRQTRIPQTSLS